MNAPSARPPRILVVDLETTGLDAKVCSILQIGAVWLSGEVGEFSLGCHEWPGAKVEDRAMEINGLRHHLGNTELSSEAEAVAALLDWTGPEECMLAGLNPSFDRAFLQEAQYRGKFNVVRRFPHRVIDLHTLTVSYAIARGDLLPNRGLYTDEIYAVLDMPPEPKPHVALTGVRMEAEALRMLMSLPELTEPATPQETGTADKL